MTRQFASLPMPRQLWWANEYRRRFGGQIRLGDSPADAVRLVNMTSIVHMDRESRRALDDMDDACREEASRYVGEA